MGHIHICNISISFSFFCIVQIIATQFKSRPEKIHGFWKINVHTVTLIGVKCFGSRILSNSIAMINVCLREREKKKCERERKIWERFLVDFLNQLHFIRSINFINTVRMQNTKQNIIYFLNFILMPTKAVVLFFHQI